MNEKSQLDPIRKAPEEAGQSMVLIAVMIIGLLAFVGLAADAGFLFARSAQFSSAVDAAALAGVVELQRSGTLDLDSAVNRAGEFLDANGWPIAQALSVDGSAGETELGIPEFFYTVTWPVDTFFMTVLGFDQIPVTHSSTAAYYALTNMPVPTHFDRGRVRTGNQFIFGPNGCSNAGDPVSSLYAAPGVANPDYPLMEGIYEYRIRVPADFITNTGQTELEVQLFDPDTINTRWGNTDPANGLTCNSAGPGDSCVIDTGEPASGNPLWLRRVDETYTVPSGPPGSACPSLAPGDPDGNSTFTRFELFYRDADGERVDVSVFESDPDNSDDTDMKWVTPGHDVAAISGDFRVNLDPVPLDENDDYNLYLHVSTTSGTSKNTWDIWAADPNTIAALPADVNERNEDIAADPTLAELNGVEVYGQGYLPLTVYVPGTVILPISAVDAVQGGGTIYASVFDFDDGADDPDGLRYGFDTLATGDYQVVRNARCEDENGAQVSCNNRWVRPQHVMGVPTIYDDPPIAFYGGFLTVTYQNSAGSAPPRDELVWSVRITSGKPFLTR
ncbi:MAG TPA: hypothetical protein VE553_07270 [Candidatus Binatia bacterium]|nr:hypothetical protein [Candidatus Binatia bacterium]